MSTIYGYTRVSARNQVDGNSLEQQRNEILAKYPNAIIKQEQFTGKVMERPIFDELIQALKKGDTLVVTKLDRFARTTTDGLNIINKLLANEITVDILTIGLMDNTPSSELIRTIFLAFAKFERDMIIERTQEGKSIASTKEGFKDGRPPKYNKKQVNNALSMLSVNGGDKSYNEVAQILKISKSTLIRWQKKYLDNKV